MIDHLVFAAPNLEAGCRLIEERLGVRPAPGGKHVGEGTHNALLSLGNGAYLEVIAPDPEQPRPATLPFGLQSLEKPRLVTWAAKAPDLERRIEALRTAGFEITGALAMSRALPDGGLLRWTLALPADTGDGLVPFLIRWEPGPHPSETSPVGCELISLRAEHPELQRVLALLTAMQIELPVSRGPQPALIAAIRSPKGAVELR